MAGRRSPASVAFLRFGIFLIVLGASLAPAGSTLGIVGIAIGAGDAPSARMDRPRAIEP